MTTEKSLIDSAIRGWKSNVERADKLFGGLSSEQLEQEVAPGRNRLIYLWGHLAAANDGLLPLLGIGERLHPEFDAMFTSNPDKSVPLTVSGQTLIVVSPETVVRWHRSGFALYWRAISRARRMIGRKRISKEVRELIFRMVAENPTWGAPRIHGELSMLGFELSERTVSRWMRRALRNPQPAKRWLAFLKNHREAIAAMDFFTVPTVTFRLLYCFFVTSHERRRILHFNVTRSRIRTCCTRNRNPPSPGQLHQPPCRSQARDGPRSVGRLDESCRYGGTGSPGEVSGQSCV